jgi:alginate production protein
MMNLKVLLVALTLLMHIGVSNAQQTPPSPEHTITGDPTRRPDDRRPTGQLTLRLFNRPLTVGGELETTLQYERDFTLGDSQDDVLRLSQELVLEFSYPLTGNLLFFVEGIAFYDSDIYAENTDRSVQWDIELGQAWVHFSNILGSQFGLQIGRQGFWEARNWWWDDDLDAVRLFYEAPRLEVELAVLRELGPVSTEATHNPEDRDIIRVLGHVEWNWARDHWLDGFFLYHNDRSSRQRVGQRVTAESEDPDDAELWWLGVRLSGDLDLGRFGELEYLVDGAWVGGREVVVDFTEEREEQRYLRVSSRSAHAVSGWALNAGLSWETEFPGRPVLTLEYALGSGDRTPERGTERAFRQTGLHSNEGRFDGVNYFHYYGDLLQPELSNLHIWTVAVGFEFWRSSSVEFLYHVYHQVHAAPFLRDARLDAEPAGKRRAIGQEWDVVVGLQEWKHLDIELVGSLFRAGPAYGRLSGQTAFSVFVEIDYNF